MRLIVEGTADEIAEVLKLLGITSPSEEAEIVVTDKPAEAETPITRSMFPRDHRGTRAFGRVTRSDLGNCKTLGDLSRLTREQVLSIYNCGPKCLGVIKQVLADHNLTFPHD